MRRRNVRLLRLALCATLAAAVGLSAALPAAAAVKRVRCALPYVAGGPNFFCTGQHQIFFTAQGFTNNNATIKAELLAIDETGNILGAIPVNSGDLARLTSGPAADFKLTSSGNQHVAVAPVPLLRVTAEDGVDRATAYCSSVPYARVFEPDGAVASESEGDVTRVLAAIPLNEGSSVTVHVDGVDVFAQLGIGNPESCRPASPCGGIIQVNGNPVTIADLVVESAPDIGTLSANMVRFTAQGLGCGGHLISVNGEPLPGAQKRFVSRRCHKDPLADTGLSSGLGLTIDSPTPGASGVPVPTQVQGVVCSGRPIKNVNVNGMSITPPGGGTLTPGDGVTSADTYTYNIDVSLPQTNLAQDFSTGNAPLGTFDAGSNRLIATATDDLGTRTFKTFYFGTGNTLNPGVDAALQQRLSGAAMDSLKERILAAATSALGPSVTIDNAFLVALSPEAVQQQFDQRCGDVDAQFKQKATQNIQAISLPGKPIEPTCSCNTTANFTIGAVGFGGNVSCQTQFQSGKIHVTIGLPAINFPITASGQCGSCDIGETKTVVSGQMQISMQNFKVEFDITESQLLNQNSTPPTTLVTGQTLESGQFHVDTPCFISQACNFFVTIGTFGFVNLLQDLAFDFSAAQDFEQAMGASEPDPIKLKEIKVDEEVVANFNQTLSGALTSVQITPNGLRAGLQGTFATGLVDAEIQQTPGALLTSPPLPSLPITGAADALIALNIDTINLMFASMTLAGRLKESCQDSGKKLGDLLPPNCEALSNPGGDAATALQQGVCHGLRLANCESLTGSTNLLRAIKQGACHGTQGDNCNTIPLPGGAFAAATEKATCTNTPDLGMRADQNILFCTRQDIPPRMAVLGGGGGTPVDTALRLKALSMALVLDRNGTGLDDQLDALPQCFGAGAPTVGDCAMFEACLDINFKFDQQFVNDVPTCGGKPGFKPVFKEVQVLNRQAGLLCSGGGLAGDDSTIVGETASSDIVTIALPQKAQQFAPPMCMKGLDLGGLVSCGGPTLLTVETDGNAAFKDFLGITCDITAP